MTVVQIAKYTGVANGRNIRLRITFGIKALGSLRRKIYEAANGWVASQLEIKFILTVVYFWFAFRYISDII